MEMHKYKLEIEIETELDVTKIVESWATVLEVWGNEYKPKMIALTIRTGPMEKDEGMALVERLMSEEGELQDLLRAKGVVGGWIGRSPKLDEEEQ